jgi:hypothetical protein
LNRVGLLQLAGCRTTSRIAAVPVIPKGGDEIADAMNIVGGQRDPGIAFPEQERIPDRMLI